MANSDATGNDLLNSKTSTIDGEQKDKSIFENIKSKAQIAMDKAKVFIVKKSDLEQMEREGPKLRTVIRKETRGDLKQVSGNSQSVETLKQKLLSNVPKSKLTSNEAETNASSKSKSKLSKPAGGSKMSSENASAATSKTSSSSKFSEALTNPVKKTTSKKSKPTSTTSSRAKSVKSSSGTASQSKLKTESKVPEASLSKPDTVSGSPVRTVSAVPAKQQTTANVASRPTFDVEADALKPRYNYQVPIDTKPPGHSIKEIREDVPSMTGQKNVAVVNTNKGVYKTVKPNNIRPSSTSDYMYQITTQNKKESSQFLKDGSPQSTANIARGPTFDVESDAVKPRYNYQVPMLAKAPGHSIKDNTKPQGTIFAFVNANKQPSSFQNQGRR